MSHYHIPPSCASPLTACVNNGSILESRLWLGPVQWCGFPTRGGGGEDGRGWWSGNSSAWAGSTLGGPLCQPHLPLTRTHDKSTTLLENLAAYHAPIFQLGWKEIWFNLPPFKRAAWVIPLKMAGELEKNAAFSKNWIGATLHLKQRVWARNRNYEAALEFACM